MNWNETTKLTGASLLLVLAHPGGYEILLDLAQSKEDGGKQYEDIKHSNEARIIAMDYLIGKLEGTTEPFPMESKGKLRPTPENPVTPTNINDDNSTMYIGAAIVVAAAVAYFIYHRRKAV